MPRSELSVMFYYVYLLRSINNGRLYIGFTKDLKKRVIEHNKGLNISTKAYVPWKLIYYETHRDEIDARRREKYLKTSAGRQAPRKMLRYYFAKQQDLSLQKVYF